MAWRGSYYAWTDSEAHHPRAVDACLVKHCQGCTMIGEHIDLRGQAQQIRRGDKFESIQFN